MLYRARHLPRKRRVTDTWSLRISQVSAVIERVHGQTGCLGASFSLLRLVLRRC
jgi:hypothetical protein